MFRNGLSRLANYQQLQNKCTQPFVVAVRHSGTGPRGAPKVEQEFNDEGFPLLSVKPRRLNQFEKRIRQPRAERNKQQPRELTMPVDQDWPSVWPTPKSFAPSAIPLPLRQSFEIKDKPPRHKYANTELMKISNFLHLSPIAIERHCAAIKKFCTKWPEELDSDETIRSHFPVTWVTKDYVHSSPSIRDPRAREVKLMIHIDDLKCPDKDRDKFLRLVGSRYNRTTGIVTITADACPTKLQNTDYANYLITALYYESKIHEEWEQDKLECDWEKFFWDKSESKAKCGNYIMSNNDSGDTSNTTIEDYKQSLEKVFDSENEETLSSYRNSVEKLLGFRQSAI